MSEGTTRYLGLDVHKASITVAVAEESGPPTAFGTVANEVGAVRKLVRQLGREAKLVAAYEAGPTGYALHREQTAAQVVFEDYRAVEQAAQERLRRLEAALRRCAEQSPQLPLMAALQVLRGIAFLSAVTIVAEVGDFRRFTNAPGFMCFTGLVTSE